MEERKFNLVELIKILLRWKKHIIIICAISAIGSVTVSLLLDDYYKSTCIFYAYNPKLADPRTLYVKDIPYDIFGKSSDVDRIISVANSSEIHRDMIKEFNLYEHYDIDTSGEYARTYALEEFRSNFEIIKNDEGALELTIYSKDKELSSEMVITMVGKVNYINIETVKENNKKLLQIYKSHMLEKEKELTSLTTKLEDLRDRYKSYLPLSKSSFNSSTSYFKENKGVDVIGKLEEQLSQVNKEYLDVKESFLQTKSTLDNFVQSLYIVEEAIPAEKKSKPTRWLIVVSACIIGFFLSTLSAVILDFYRSDVKHLLS